MGPIRWITYPRRMDSTTAFFPIFSDNAQDHVAEQNVKTQHKQCRQSHTPSNNDRKGSTSDANQAIIEYSPQKELKAQTARWVRGRLEVLQYTLEMLHCFPSLFERHSPRLPTLYLVLGSRGQSRFQGHTKSIPIRQGFIPRRQI